jgi:hypothetical protein
MGKTSAFHLSKLLILLSLHFDCQSTLYQVRIWATARQDLTPTAILQNYSLLSTSSIAAEVLLNMFSILLFTSLKE